MRSVILAVLLSVTLGGLAVVTPAFFMTRAPSHLAPLFPLVHVAVEGFGLAAVLGLFTAGLITKLMFRGAPSWLIGLASMAAFPAMAIGEILIDPRSHSLFPFEFIIYLAECVLAMFGALIGLAWLRFGGLLLRALHGA